MRQQVIEQLSRRRQLGFILIALRQAQQNSLFGRILFDQRRIRGQRLAHEALLVQEFGQRPTKFDRVWVKLNGSNQVAVSFFLLLQLDPRPSTHPKGLRVIWLALDDRGGISPCLIPAKCGSAAFGERFENEEAVGGRRRGTGRRLRTTLG